MGFSSSKQRWLLAVLVQSSTNIVNNSASAVSLDAAILADVMEAFNSHEPTSCSSDDHASSTTFTFSYPGTNPDSDWNPNAAGFEEGLFAAMMTHTDGVDPKKSWQIRVGTGGNIYSHLAPNAHGESVSPQADYAYGTAWVDEVNQMVSVNTAICGGSRFSVNPPCPKYYVHAAGAYDDDSPYTDASPVYSPLLAKHCEGNSCTFASWGTHAHVPTPFISHAMYFTRYTNCGNGIIEHTQTVHNFAPVTSWSFFTNLQWINDGWGGVRASNLPIALEPKSDGTLPYSDPNTANYLPLCHWGNDPAGLHSSRSVDKDLTQLGGYTTFVGKDANGKHLLVNRDVQLERGCRKPGVNCRGNEANCMVESCTDAQVADEGYVRVPLVMRRQPACKVHRVTNPFGTYVPLQCNLRGYTNYGHTRPYASSPDPCAPWKHARIGIINKTTGAVLEVAYMRHWSWSARNYRTYFSVYVDGYGNAEKEAYAISMVNNMFYYYGTKIHLGVITVYMSDVKPWCRAPDGTMVAKCNEYQIGQGYTRPELAIPPGGPACTFDPDNTYNGYVGLACRLRKQTGFGALDAPEYEPIGLYRAYTGMTLRISHVKHWSKDPADDLVYFSTEILDDGVNGTARQAAIDSVHNIFSNAGTDYVPLEIRALGPPPTTAPADYNPDSLPTFSYVYGTGEGYGPGVGGKGTRRIGGTVGYRDYTVFTTIWSRSNLNGGQTYQNRGYLAIGDLASAKATNDELVSKVYIDKQWPNEWNARTVGVYESGGSFAAVAASSPQGTVTSCGASNLNATCTGLSAPFTNHVPFFYVTCEKSTGTASYFGPNPYKLAPTSGTFTGDDFERLKDKWYTDAGVNVRSYACEGEGLTRPSWKLMGFFEMSDPACAALSGHTLDETICSV